ncbi:FecR domain-containing protein [uncultured Tateyamaria sp.]|uniref:FecR domain-containing protein n=1 Tax=uncultured Tateyamaria sp. TaxID=455651 RepID=UPI00260258B4|nr:FecR domain-containing protein [uncultured Tateyamaria sp.]
MGVLQFERMARRCLTAAVCAAASALSAVAQDRSDLNAPLETVVFTASDTLRGVVAEHLNDPDLWPYILELNAIRSPASVVPGTALRMPVKQVRAADAALAESLAAIQRANAEGAQVFAPEQIGAAIENRETAVERRDVGAWVEVVDFSDIATVLAVEALEISIAQRDRSAEAIVSDVHGNVEGRAPQDPGWSGRGLSDVLVEFERVRTLSESTTQVTFRDLSRLRLNANSNATIQRMRSDPLTGEEVTRVSLVEGDFYALLNPLSDKSAFEVDVPGIETKTNSTDFWVRTDANGARFVNFDAPGLRITDGDQTIEVGQNEGLVVGPRGAEQANVLEAVQLTAPARDAILYDGFAPLGWAPFEGAEAYWIEVALDPGFNQMKVSQWGVRGTAFDTVPLPPRRYHWRVAALDRLGLPGQWSRSRSFTLREDTNPPFLTLLSPSDGAIVGQSGVEVFGASEPNADVTLNDDPVPLGTDGSFVLEAGLRPGTNVLTLRAVDPAGNESVTEQSVIYRPDAQVRIGFAPDLPRVGDALATRSANLSVVAMSNAAEGADVQVRSGDAVVVRSRVETNGAIRFSVPAGDAPTDYTLVVLGPTGRIEGRAAFQVVRDQVPPNVMLDAPLPRATDMAVATVAGIAIDAVKVTLNGAPVPLAGGRFAVEVPLSPGLNAFDLVAVDAVGNVHAARLQTLYDVEPPDVLSVELIRPNGLGGPIELVVVASDVSGLRQAAPYLLQVGEVEREGFLRCDAETGICRASLPAEPGDLRLIEVAIEDYVGNVVFR